MNDQNKIIGLAESAQRLLDEPAFAEALSRIEAALTQAFIETPVRDVEGLQLCRQSLAVFHMIEGRLKGCIEAGKLEKFKLEELRKDSKISQFNRKYL